MKKIIFLIIFLTSLSFSLVQKQSTNRSSSDKTPIYIEANSMDYQDNTIIYKGNVVATKGDSKLTAQNLIIYLDKNKKIEKIIASGNAVYTSPDKQAKGDTIEYDMKNDIITITGNAEVVDKGNIVKGDKIVYYKKQDKAIASGKRVKTLIIQK